MKAFSVLVCLALVGAALGKTSWTPLELTLRSILHKDVRTRAVDALPAECTSVIGDFVETVAGAMEEVVPAGIAETIAGALPDDPGQGLKCITTPALQYILNLLDNVVLADPSTDWSQLQILHCFAIVSKLGIQAEIVARGSEPYVLPPECPAACPLRSLKQYPTCVCDALVDDAVEVVQEILEADEDSSEEDFDWKYAAATALGSLEEGPLCAAKIVAGMYLSTIAMVSDTVSGDVAEDECGLLTFIPHTMCFAGFIVKEIDELIPDACPLLPPTSMPVKKSDKTSHQKSKKSTISSVSTKHIEELISRLLNR